MITQNNLSSWLQDLLIESSDKKYRHRLFTEQIGKRDEILQEITQYVQNAHEDARNRLRKIAEDTEEDTLDPFGPSVRFDPAEGYPEIFHIQTLKGYFGEIIAGLIAEYFSPFGEDGWKVPAFLFRYHTVEFQQLEIIRQTGREAKLRTGRTGDDCLAFQLDDSGEIIRSLYCEAKCTPAGSRAGMIRDAYKKASESFLVDLPQIIEILKLRNDPADKQWIRALQQLWFASPNHKSERCDMVSYVCGESPSEKKRYSWLPANEPHEKYTAQRRLEAVEIYLPDVEALIRKVYGKKDKIQSLALITSATEEYQEDAFNR